MTIEQLDTSKVLISLCNEDMKNFELQFENMSFYSEHSKRILLRILKLACMKAGVSCKSKTVLMEALPHQSGCLILVTMMDGEKRKTYKVKKTEKKPCFAFEGAEEMLTGVEKLYRSSFSLHSNSLWMCEGRYYLIFDYPLVQECVRRILMEYAVHTACPQVEIARIKERGKLLCGKSAVDIIGRSITA